MTRASALLLAALTALPFAACSGTSGAVREPAPDVEQRQRELAEEDARRRDFQAVLLQLDQGMDSYVQALANRGEPRADKQAEQLEKLIRDLVLDDGLRTFRAGADGVRPPNAPPGENYRRLQAVASDGSNPNQQAIALAALGFSGRREVMPLIVQGAMLSDPFVVDRAVLGLATLRAPDTPPGVLAAIVERAEHPEDGRVQAAWALYRIQGASPDPSEIVALWRRFLTSERDRMPPGVLMTAVRGLGLTGDDPHAELVASFLQSPVPRIRMSAALAIGRMNAQDHWQELLELLGPRETVQNVRLHARKALAALAGNEDYGYDVAAWRKVFERGR